MSNITSNSTDYINQKLENLTTIELELLKLNNTLEKLHYKLIYDEKLKILRNNIVKLINEGLTNDAIYEESINLVRQYEHLIIDNYFSLIK